MTKEPIYGLCGVFLLLNFLTLLPLGGNLPGITLLWALISLPPVIHCCLWTRADSYHSPAGKKRLTLCGWLLGLIWAATLYCIIMHLIQPDALIAIAIAVLSGGTGFLHILITAVLMLSTEQ